MIPIPLPEFNSMQAPLLREQEWRNAVRWLLCELEACHNLSGLGSAGGGIMKSTAISLTKKAFGTKKK